jgi:hypothetical protein
MRNVKLVTFCTDDFEISARLLAKSALKNGVDTIYIKRPSDISSLIETHSNIFDNEKGFGFYCWHPFVIKQVMEESNPNDIIIYCDSGIKIKYDITPLIKPFDNTAVNFHFFYVGGHHSNRTWTKAETFNQLNFNSEPDLYQLMGGFQIYRCCDQSKDFINLMCQKIIDPVILFSNTLTNTPNPPFFREHRHNQSLLTILCHQFLDPISYFISNEPSQYGYTDNTLTNYQHMTIDRDYLYIHRQRINIPKVIVITPTTGASYLEDAIKSVQSQDYLNVDHVVVCDGQKFENKTRQIINKYLGNGNSNIIGLKFLVLPYNTGANNWICHRIYSSLPNLLPTANFVTFLDEDNFYEPDHISSLVKLTVNNNLDWCYCLRNIYEDNQFICKDECESMGHLLPVWNDANQRLIDTGCYMLSRRVAVKVSQLGVWDRPARPPVGLEADRLLARILLNSKDVKFDCSRQYTLNYRVANRSDSVKKEFFINGNKIIKDGNIIKNGQLIPISQLNDTSETIEINTDTDTNTDTNTDTDTNTEVNISTNISTHIDKTKFKIPTDTNNLYNYSPPIKHLETIYICHFNDYSTHKYFCLPIPRDRHYSMDQWEMTLLDYLCGYYNLKNAYIEDVPSGAIVLFVLCHMSELREDLINRTDITKILYTKESPNIRHQSQWSLKYLKQFNIIMTYPSFATYKLPYSKELNIYPCKFVHSITEVNYPLLKNIDENSPKINNRKCCIVLENRHLSGQYEIEGHKFECLDYLREKYVSELYKNNMIDCYGSGWNKYGGKEDNRNVIDIQQPYLFSLIIENCDASGYVSEKIYNAFAAGCIPLYYGNNNEFVGIPSDMYVNLNNYSPEELVLFINQISTVRIKKYLSFIDANRKHILQSSSPQHFATTLQLVIKDIKSGCKNDFISTIKRKIQNI